LWVGKSRQRAFVAGDVAPGRRGAGPTRDLSCDEPVVDGMRGHAQGRGDWAHCHLLVDVEPSQAVGFGGVCGHKCRSNVSKENAAALPRCRALPTFVVWRAFALVGRAFLDGRKVSKEIAATGPRCRFEPTWCVASRRADSRGRIGGAPRGARTMIGGRAVGPRRRRSRPRSSFRHLQPTEQRHLAGDRGRSLGVVLGQTVWDGRAVSAAGAPGATRAAGHDVVVNRAVTTQ